MQFREILQRELESRKLKNPYYSQRAFARDLRISSGRLTSILTQKSGISLKTAQKIAAQLHLTKEEHDLFCQLVIAECARDEKKRNKAKANLDNVFAENYWLNSDQFSVIADWYHFAILEMLSLENPPQDVPRIAARLEISEETAKHALDRLKELKLIKKENGKWKATERNTYTGGTIPSRAIRSFHSQIIQKAQQSIEDVPMEKRQIYSEILPIDPNKMEEAKTALLEFKQKFCNQINDISGEKTKVYALSIQLFPLEKM